jgi:hypothetical protein
MDRPEQQPRPATDETQPDQAPQADEAPPLEEALPADEASLVAEAPADAEMPVHVDASSPRWDITQWELPAVYARIKAKILELESAWEERRLDLALEDRELLRVVGHDVRFAYEHLLASHTPRFPEFRRASIHALLDQVKAMLRAPHTWFQVQVVCDEPFLIEVECEDGAALLRQNQALVSPFWGIGFEFDDPSAGDCLATRLVRRTLQRLGGDLHGLQAIQTWLKRRHAKDSPQIVPDAVGRHFEQLMVDILNEEDHIANRAPLFEDFLQKTDLRVVIPDLGRPRGARVQVTQTTHAGQHDEKLSRIRNLAEFVILSPRSLAIALGEEDGARLLSGPDRDHFWECLQRPPASIEELAGALKGIFRSAIARATDDPRGPRAAVPAPVRLLVRRFVIRDAYRTTVELRRRELREGKWKHGSPKLDILRRHGLDDGESS